MRLSVSILLRYLLGGLLCLMFVTAIYKMTERTHFEESLQRALWKLRQSDGPPQFLQAEGRLKLLRQLRSPSSAGRQRQGTRTSCAAASQRACAALDTS